MDDTQPRPLMAETPGHDNVMRAAVPVVGIGASAGGLEIFKRLLGLIPVVFVRVRSTPAGLAQKVRDTLDAESRAA